MRLGGSVERDADAARPAAGLAVTERGDGDGTRRAGSRRSPVVPGSTRPSRPERCRSDDDQRRVALLRERLQELCAASRRAGRRLRRAGRRPRARRSPGRAGVRRPRRPPGSPRRRSPRRRARAPGTAPRSPAAAPRRPARASSRASASASWERSDAVEADDDQAPPGSLRLLLGDEPGALRREVQRLVLLVPADAEVAVPGGAEHREDLPAAGWAAADRVDGDPVARPRVVDPRSPRGCRAGGHRLVACAAGASARTSALCVPRGTTITGQLASRITACVTLPSSTWRAGP